MTSQNVQSIKDLTSLFLTGHKLTPNQQTAVLHERHAFQSNQLLLAHFFCSFYLYSRTSTIRPPLYNGHFISFQQTELLLFKNNNNNNNNNNNLYFLR